MKIRRCCLMEFDKDSYKFHIAGSIVGFIGSCCVLATFAKHPSLLAPFSRKLILCQSICDLLLCLVWIVLPPDYHITCVLQAFLGQTLLISTLIWSSIIVYVLLRATALKSSIASPYQPEKDFRKFIIAGTLCPVLVAVIPLAFSK